MILAQLHRPPRRNRRDYWYTARQLPPDPASKAGGAGADAGGEAGGGGEPTRNGGRGQPVASDIAAGD